MKKEYFLKRVESVYGNNRFSFVDLPEEFTNRINITVVCNKHGAFNIQVCNFLNGRGCPYCNKEKNTVSYSQFKQLVDNKYGIDSYLLCENDYKAFTNGKISIHCNKHNLDFKQTPKHFLEHIGCSECARESYEKKYYEYLENERIKHENNFIEKSRQIHGDKYDYSKVHYMNCTTKVTIVCPIHGDFEIAPQYHLNGRGCRRCNHEYVSNINELNDLLIKKFGIEYDFSKSKFHNMSTKITVGYNGYYFDVTPTKLLHPDNKKPIKHNRVDCLQKFIEKAKLKHGDKYDYSLINEEIYKNTLTKIPIICKKHGVFHITPDYHMQGIGCPYCRKSKLEISVRKILSDKSIEFYENYTPNFLKSNKYSNKSYDFFLPEYNIAIECQGNQHFRPISFFGGDNGFNYRLKNDIEKYTKSSENNINLIYLKTKEISLDEIIHDNRYCSIYNKQNTFSSVEQLDKYLAKLKKQSAF